MGREGFAALLFRIGGKQPASDFDASSLGITFADQATLSVALDLAELIAIDRGVKGGARLLACASAGERTQQGIEYERRQNGENDPEQHLGRTSAYPGRLAIGERPQGGKLRERGAR